MLNLITALLIILFAAFSRVLPHPPNFAPVVAIALFSGAYFNKKYALIIPLAAMFLSDIFIGFHTTMIWIYGSFVLITFLAFQLKNNKKLLRIAYTTLASSVLFFIITNFGVWAGGMYGYSFSGLIECYTMAIPFFRNSLAGDVFYVTAMFGLYEIVTRYVLRTSVQTVNK